MVRGFGLEETPMQLEDFLVMHMIMERNRKLVLIAVWLILYFANRQRLQLFLKTRINIMLRQRSQYKPKTLVLLVIEMQGLLGSWVYLMLILR